MSDDVIVTITVDDRSTALRALDTLQGLSGGGLSLQAAAVVVRDPDGEVHVGDRVGDPAPRPRHPVLAGLLGLVVAALDTVVAGSSLLSATGAVSSPQDTAEAAAVHLAVSVPPGRAALLAAVTEEHPEVLDGAVDALGATVERRSAEALREEMDAAAGRPTTG